jgi:hypothetical protein
VSIRAYTPTGNGLLAAASAAQTAAKRDKVVFVFNFFDELRRLAPVKK